MAIFYCRKRILGHRFAERETVFYRQSVYAAKLRFARRYLVRKNNREQLFRLLHDDGTYPVAVAYADYGFVKRGKIRLAAVTSHFFASCKLRAKERFKMRRRFFYIFFVCHFIFLRRFLCS